MRAKEKAAKAGLRWLTPTVLALGAVSLLTDVSGEMVAPLLPAFITTVLGGGALYVGLVDGLADLSNSLLQLAAGRRVDRTGRRKPLVPFGYGLSGLIRPLMGFATAPWQAVAVRVSDRVGKGLRSAPRDHLLYQEATPKTRGRVFSFHRAMDHTGAVLGPLAALLLLGAFHGDLRKVFLWAAVPGVLAFVTILWAVREKPLAPPSSKPLPWAWLPPREVRPFFAALFVFNLGASTDLFLLLKAGQSDVPLMALPLLWMAFHGVKVASSLGAGSLADRWGERPTIALGWLLYAAVYTALAFISDRAWVTGIFIVYGLYHGLTEGPEKALVSHLAPARVQGAAFGWYNLVFGLLSVPASLFFGWLYDAYSPRAAFLSGGLFALAGLALLWILPVLRAAKRRT